MSIWESLDELGTTIVGGAGNIVDAIATKAGNVIGQEKTQTGEETVRVDQRNVPSQGVDPGVIGFFKARPDMLALLVVGGIAIYAVVKK